MTLLAEKVYDVITSLASGGGNVPALSNQDIANYAGRWLCKAHPWRWLARPPAHLDLRGSISITGATWTESTKTLTKTAAFTNYTYLDGDEIAITSGTGATVNTFPIGSKTSANAIVLKTSIGSAADAQTDIAGTMNLWGVAMPTDFGECVEIVPDQGLFSYAQEIDYESLLRLRTQTAGSQSPVFYYSWSMSDPTVPGPPVQRLELARAPASSDPGGLVMAYRRKWTDFSADNDVARIPDWLESLYLRCAYVEARSWIFEAPTAAQRLAEMKASPEWHDALRADGALSGTVGMMRGGAAAMYHATNMNWHRTDVVVNVP